MTSAEVCGFLAAAALARPLSLLCGLLIAASCPLGSWECSAISTGNSGVQGESHQEPSSLFYS